MKPAPMDSKPLASGTLQVSWRVRSEVFLWRHGWIWPACAALALACAALYLVTWASVSERSLRTQSDLALTKQRLTGARSGATARRDVTETSGEARQAAVYTVLRTVPGTEDQIREMSVIAQKHGIALLQGDYQYISLPEAGVEGVQLSLPVRGGYRPLRAFVQDVLLALPNASLEQMSVKRDAIGTDQGEARLRWVLWSSRPRAAGSAAPSPRQEKAP